MYARVISKQENAKEFQKNFKTRLYNNNNNNNKSNRWPLVSHSIIDYKLKFEIFFLRSIGCCCCCSQQVEKNVNFFFIGLYGNWEKQLGKKIIKIEILHWEKKKRNSVKNLIDSYGWIVCSKKNKPSRQQKNHKEKCRIFSSSSTSKKHHSSNEWKKKKEEFFSIFFISHCDQEEKLFFSRIFCVFFFVLSI